MIKWCMLGAMMDALPVACACALASCPTSILGVLGGEGGSGFCVLSAVGGAGFGVFRGLGLFRSVFKSNWKGEKGFGELWGSCGKAFVARQS